METKDQKRELKILVVDDDPDVLGLIARVLHQNNYIVTTATSRNECFRAIQAGKPDLLLLDVILGDASGMEICKTLKGDPETSSIYVLLMSGRQIHADSVSEGLEFGADGYLIKPLKNRELLAWVNAAFRTIRAEFALKESEDRYMHILKTISDISYSCLSDHHGSHTIDWMVGAAERITGYTVEELTAMKCWSALVIEQDMAIFRQYVSGLMPGSTGQCDLRLLNKNGSIVWVASYAECILLSKEPVETRLYGALVDITGRKRAESELSDKLDKLHRFHQLSVGRELKMIELKMEVNDLLTKSGKEEKYLIIN